MSFGGCLLVPGSRIGGSHAAGTVMLNELANGQVEILYEVFLRGEVQHQAPAFL
jgi:hypothetical protein